MRKKCSKELYCQFLLAAQKNFTATNFAEHTQEMAHDAVTRFLSGTKLQPRTLWEYAERFVDKENGYLVCDDTVLDKWYGNNIKLTRWQYSGTHHRVVHGVGLTTLLWTTGEEHIPVDFRVYAPEDDGMTKNEHFREMLKLAKHRGMEPQIVVMDSWYAAVDTLHQINNYDWIFVAGLKSNRVVRTGTGKGDKYNIKNLPIPDNGRIVHLKKFGQVKVFRITTTDGRTEYYATNNLSSSSADIRDAAARRWKIEEYHRGLKQTVGIENCQARTARSQRTHIYCSILSFLALEKKRLEDGITWYESKRRIIADSLFLYLQRPMIPLPVATC